MSARRTPPRGAPSGRGQPAGAKRAGQPGWAVGLAVIVGVLVIIVVASLALRPRSQTAAGSGGLPGPIGGPELAQDVNTLIGKPAPTFTLPDSDGKRYTVTPGQGRPLVLISHMGIT
jgi:hypothetical protein